jgi:hypothetical protein
VTLTSGAAPFDRKRLRRTAGCVALDATEPHERAETLLAEPLAVVLRSEVLGEDAHLLAAQLVGQLNEHAGLPEVTVILRHLVLEDEVVAERLSCELRHQAVVLVGIRVGIPRSAAVAATLAAGSTPNTGTPRATKVSEYDA